jgi:hypothetical protein
MNMADEGTARTLVTVAAWLQLIFFLAGLGVIAWFFILFPEPLIFLFIAGFYVVFSIFGIIFFILWFQWKNDPTAHKTGLIVTGVLGLFLAFGWLPGLLVLIAGIIAPSEAA